MEFEEIKDWANQNQGFLTIILFLASLFISWISRLCNRILKKEDIKASSNISMSNKFIQKGGKNSKNVQGENITVNKYNNVK